MTELLETLVESRRVIYPEQTNQFGTTHGGKLLQWMEQIGAMAAMRLAGNDVVAVGMDGARFRHPIPQGQIALTEAYVYEAGESSVRARVRAFEEDRHSGERTLATEAFMVTVALDADASKAEVPALAVDSEEGERLLEAALEAESVDGAEV